MRTERLFKYSFYPKRFLFFLAGSMLLLIFSCENKPDFIGRDLLPSGDNFRVSFDSMEITNGFTLSADSLPIISKEYFFLGSIMDPLFGVSRSEIITTISSSTSSMGFGSNPDADSVILYISWENYSGEGSMPQNILLYEYTEFISYDTTYFSNMDVTGKYRETEIGSARASKNDSIIKFYISDQEFIDKFLTAEDSILKSTSLLQKLIYGLYLKTDDAMDEGFMFNFNFSQGNNSLNFYYHNDSVFDGFQYFSMNNTSNGHLNLFRHDPSGYPLNEYIMNGSENDSMIFVQSLAGAYSLIRFPGLTNWIDSMPIAINEARLIIPIADTVLTMQHRWDFPEYLNMYLLHESGKYSQTYDYVLDPVSFGGKYDQESNSYIFSIKVQMQSILSGDVGNLDMVLTAANTSSVLSRAVLYAWNNDPRKRIRLEIIYTDL